MVHCADQPANSRWDDRQPGKAETIKIISTSVERWSIVHFTLEIEKHNILIILYNIFFLCNTDV